MYNGKLNLVNKSNVKLALSNDFFDVIALQDAVRGCENAQEFCEVANKYHIFKTKWSIGADYTDLTRLVHEDALGNIHYLFAEKTKAVNTSTNKKQKILDTLLWYKTMDDEGDVTKAREKGEVLYSLLEELLVQE